MIQSYWFLLCLPSRLWGCAGGVSAQTDPGLSLCLGARLTSPKMGDPTVLGLPGWWRFRAELSMGEHKGWCKRSQERWETWWGREPRLH